MAEHSPLPWIIDPDNDCRILSGSTIVLEDAGDDAVSANEEDVALIVRAVNNFTDLLAGLKLAQLLLDRFVPAMDIYEKERMKALAGVIADAEKS